MAVRHDLSLIVAALALAAAPAALAQPRGPAPQRHRAAPIYIEDFTFGVAQTEVFLGGKGDKAGKVSVGEIHVSRKADGASHRLWQAATSGAAVPKLVIDTLRHGKRVKVVLHDVTVSGYQRNGSAERFTLTPRSGEIVG